MSFIEDEASPLVGDAAKSYLTRNPTGTLFNVLRILGRKSDDPVFQTDKSSFPFNVINEGGWPKVLIVHQGEEKSYYPEEILSILFSYMKVTAETYLGVVVTAAVVAVPGCFNHAKQQAIRCAAGMAGLNVHRIMANAMGATEVQYSHFQIAGTKDKSKEPVHKISIEVDC